MKIKIIIVMASTTLALLAGCKPKTDSENVGTNTYNSPPVAPSTPPTPAPPASTNPPPAQP